MMTTSETRDRILLVEDDQLQAIFIQAVLGKEYEVVTAYSLCEALETLSYQSFNAVVLDLGLPDSGGADTLDSITAAARATPVVVLTGSSPDADLNVMRHGAQDFIRKSEFNLQTFRRSLRFAMERKRLEERIVHGQKLEAVGELSAGVAHEFNNLLQTIRGYAKMALDDLDVDSNAFSDIKKVVGAADDAARITRQLLSFGRRVALQRERLDLNDLLRDQMDLVRTLIEETVIISTNIAENDAFVRVDPTAMRQVILNLCINARDAMPDGGELYVASDTVSLDEGDLLAGDYVEIVVKDTGCGMTPEVLSHVFEPFFTTKAVGQGTGMGMSMVYGAVRQHGGDVHVSTEVGAGTSFRVLIPQSTAPDETVEETDDDSELNGGRRETILIVEDNPSVRELCDRVLAGNDYRTLVARDGVEAIQLFEAHRRQIDLLVLDVVMPRMTGRDVYELVSSLEPDIPFVFCTGYPLGGDHVRFANDVKNSVILEKPFQRETLLREVRKAIDRKGATLVPV